MTGNERARLKGLAIDEVNRDGREVPSSRFFAQLAALRENYTPHATNAERSRALDLWSQESLPAFFRLLIPPEKQTTIE